MAGKAGKRRRTEHVYLGGNVGAEKRPDKGEEILPELRRRDEGCLYAIVTHSRIALFLGGPPGGGLAGGALCGRMKLAT